MSFELRVGQVQHEAHLTTLLLTGAVMCSQRYCGQSYLQGPAQARLP